MNMPKRWLEMKGDFSPSAFPLWIYTSTYPTENITVNKISQTRETQGFVMFSFIHFDVLHNQAILCAKHQSEMLPQAVEGGGVIDISFVDFDRKSFGINFHSRK